MSANSSIEWTETTWNPVTGCTKVSQGCKNCYAETVANRFWKDRKFTDVQMHEGKLDQPLHWKKPRRIFVNSMSDLFHEDVSYDFICSVFMVMERCMQHTFQILTKRPQRALDFFEDHIPLPPSCKNLPNVWLGVSVEDQQTADERIPLLLQTPAAVRWVSAEPLLKGIYLHPDWIVHRKKCTECRGTGYYGDNGPGVRGNREYMACDQCTLARLTWLVIGGESGPGARPFNIEWARSIIKQCKDAGVPVFMKQVGANLIGAAPYETRDYGNRITIRRLKLNSRKGGDINEWPTDLQVREYPNTP